MGASRTGVACFYCGEDFPKNLVVGALCISHPTAMDKFITASLQAESRREVLQQRMDFLADAKRLKVMSLGERLVHMLTNDWHTCCNCGSRVCMFDPEDGLGTVECMHMTCQMCEHEMCGYCLKSRDDCNSFFCPLNPLPFDEGHNVSASKAKSSMVILASRVAAELDSHSPEARAEALAFAAEAFRATRKEGVGELSPAQPWLFVELFASENSPVYVTSILRTRLHLLFRGASGLDAPAVVYGDLRCGDLVRLIDLKVDGVPAITSMLQDVDELPDAVDDQQIAQLQSGRHGVVLDVRSSVVELRMGSPYREVLVVDWEAVASVRPLDKALEGIAATLGPPATGDYVLICADARDKCAESYGWHPEMAKMVGKWVLVIKGGSSVSFTAKSKHLLHAFPMSCCQACVSGDAVVDRANAS